MKKRIFKFQIPLNCKLGEGLALVYDRKREYQGQFPVDENTLKIMNGRPKTFVYGTVDKEGKVMVDGPAPWQDW